MENLYNIKSAYAHANQFYGITMDSEIFDDMALTAWEMIGNKHSRLYRLVADTNDKEIKLPCNAQSVESVTIPVLDSQETSNLVDGFNSEAMQVESYIEKWNRNSEFNQTGKYIDYREVNGVLYFDKDYKNVTILYSGIQMDDEDNLPLITSKEMRAIAAFVAYSELYKRLLTQRSQFDKINIQLLGDMKQDWLRKCNEARIKEHLSQNDMNNILDAKVRCERKRYGKSLKPIL